MRMWIIKKEQDENEISKKMGMRIIKKNMMRMKWVKNENENN